ncbi:MAG: glycosyltransferase [Moorea sp. SIO4E2]|uniref:glycosyltransferase family 2 protein n=1 Tax=Moorena sp. SIO4E2 TaxID=2607826 RepID=UPI0013B9E577|nr:glycosyltransferase [Moorena sp. SIO4E2]NEQ05165.1 glycosyltransferase [Moorena sp. SIO4E2]
MNHFASIIINNFNYGRFLRNSIDSALEQSYDFFEVIVVDDGSEDDSHSIIASYGNKVKAIFKENAGQASAFNVGFKASKGDIICFLDADDMLLPNAISQAAQKFYDSHVVKVHWPLHGVDAELKKLGKVIPPGPLSRGDLLEKFISTGPEGMVSPPTSGNAWSRNFLEKICPMPEEEYRNGADYYLNSLAFLMGRVESLLDCQGLYRIHGNNGVSRVPYKRRLRICKHLRNTLSKYLDSQGYDFNICGWESSYYDHVELMTQVGEKLSLIVTSGSSYILIDMNEWGQGSLVENSKCVPFLEKSGLYWGLPESDDNAIFEFERLRSLGIEFCVFGWPAFWWFEHYKGFCQYLYRHCKCLLEDEQLIIFKL